MMMLLNYIWTLLSVLIIGTGAHDFHLSKTDVHYKTEQQAVQITIHTFIDDTEAALSQKVSLPYKFFESQEHPATDSIFYSYLQEHVIVKIDGQTQAYTYLGKEQSDDIQGVYTYLEIENVAAFDNMDVELSLFTELFDDQRNIINVKVDNKSKAFEILSSTDTTKHIDL